MFLFWYFCHSFSNQRALIALEFNFRFWEQLVINVNKDIEKVSMRFVGVFIFFNVIPISVVQNIFKFVKKIFTVRAFVGRFDDCSLRCFIGFNWEDNRNMIWQVSFYYGWLKFVVACYTIGDKVVYGISWVSDLSCWLLKLEEKFNEVSVKVLVSLRLEKPPFLNSRIKPGRFPLMWLPVLLQAIIGVWCWKIESGEEVSLSKFTHKTGETSSDIFAGFTSGFHWLLILQNSGEEVSSSENSNLLELTIFDFTKILSFSIPNCLFERLLNIQLFYISWTPR